MIIAGNCYISIVLTVIIISLLTVLYVAIQNGIKWGIRINKLNRANKLIRIKRKIKEQ
jgi:hypothetical protein